MFHLHWFQQKSPLGPCLLKRHLVSLSAIMSEEDVLIGPGTNGDYVASFGNIKSDQIDPMSREHFAVDDEAHIDPDTLTEALSDHENNSEAAVLTSTPIQYKGVCFDSTVDDEDREPLVAADSLMRNPSEGTDGDLEAESEESSQYDDDVSQEGDHHREVNILRHVMSLDHSRESLMVPGLLKVPIIGYETMEARSKFTIYKIHVMMGEEDPGWFVFRRYSDFVHLNEQLREEFPNMRLALPPKRWFRSNFDPDFLQDRKVGLQDFLENVTGHRDILSSQPVRDFFCFDDPPSIHDSLEESRAQCECLEEMTHLLRKELGEKEIEMELLKEEIDLYKNQVRLLTDRLSEFNKTICLQEKASLDSRNLSSMSTPSLRMRSLNMRSSLTDMEKSDSDLKVTSPDLNQSRSDADNCEFDSNIPHSTPVREITESEETSSALNTQCDSVSEQSKVELNLNTLAPRCLTSEQDLLNSESCDFKKSVEDAAKDGGQGESFSASDGGVESETVQSEFKQEEVDLKGKE
ncbi:hypothetical protein RRG08_019821 [Elysia crispata]|uniref:PX domain-containing protein n=1 Tax=Elysia crispata TaxID=231223 RepID=A0AAE0YTU8_9GAST|nr:hypothetical protein RRG08_019821 [Elysia crispata]